MEKILVSACLLGEKVRYHGGDAKIQNQILEQWRQEGRIVPLCPEVSAGFSVPRPPSEIEGTGGGEGVLSGTAKVVKEDGSLHSEQFIKGAKIALEVAKKNVIKIAILKDGSPSCGSERIYSGDFTGKKLPGFGVTAALLVRHGVRVFSENQLEAAENLLKKMEQQTR